MPTFSTTNPLKQTFVKKISIFFLQNYKFLIGALIALYLVKCAYGGGDFRVYLFEATKLRNGENIYLPPYFEGMLYTYSTLWALVLIPFSYIPTFIVCLLWLFLDLFFIKKIIHISRNWLDIDSFSSSLVNKIWLYSFLLIIRFLLYNFGMVQITIFLMWGSFYGIDLIFYQNKKLYGSFWLALVMNIKLLPLVFLPYLFYRKEYQSFLYTCLFLIFFTFLPAMFIGWNFNLNLLSDWWLAINPSSDTRMLGETANGTIGLNALIPTLFMNTEGDFDYKRNLMQLDAEIVSWILNGARLLLIILTLYFLKKPFQSVENKIYLYWEISYLFCIIPLLAPQQQKYAFIFTFPAILFTIYFILIGKKLNINKNRIQFIVGLLILFFFLTTFTTDGIIGKHMKEVAQYYRTITYGGIVMVIILVLVNPKFLNLQETPRDIFQVK